MANKDWKKKKDVKFDGKKAGVVIVNNRGKEKTLLNPHGKFVKYSNELESGVCLTNDGVVKVDRDGDYRGLTPEQAAYRAGYRSAIIDQTKVYKARRGGNR